MDRKHTRPSRRRLRAARHHIHLETFIFGADDVGRRFADLIRAEAREGIEVRVLYDSIGSMETPRDFFDELRRQGIEVREFRPMNPIKTRRSLENPQSRSSQDHRRRRQVGFTGGINIDSTYSSASTSKPGPKRGIEDGWRDTHVRIQGPAVTQLQALFFESWERQGTRELHAEDGILPGDRPAGDDSRHDRRQRQRI